MPRTVDHDERRAAIAEALVRVAARDGLHAATMRAVATEAGVSLRLVQYYFATKAGLLRGALEQLERESHARWAARVPADEDGAPATPRATLGALVAEAIPDDEESRAFHLVWTAFAVLAATDPKLAAERFVAGPDRLEARIAALLEDARSAGDLPADREVRTEATVLLGLVNGLGTSVLVGQRPAAEAVAAIEHHLDRLFAMG